VDASLFRFRPRQAIAHYRRVLDPAQQGLSEASRTPHLSEDRFNGDLTSSISEQIFWLGIDFSFSLYPSRNIPLLLGFREAANDGAYASAQKTAAPAGMPTSRV